MGPKGRVVEIERFAVHDGPGIRTTVFLKGCPLRCLWCHNPETMKRRSELSFAAEKCIGCGACVAACPAGAHTIDGDVQAIDRSVCRACGICGEACEAHALEVVGREWSVEEVMAEVRRDLPFYRRSGGGLTVSGGEPLMQLEFTAALFEAARADGVHCAIETSGFARWESLARVLPLVDLFLYDCKETDAQRHKQLTGQPNGRILENLRRLYESGAAIVLQCPIIPGHNDTEAHFEGIARLAQAMPALRRVQLLPYHPLGKSKLARFGFEVGVSIESPTRERVEGWVAWFVRRGVAVVA
jgi:pyruvate formate lyase activating enzyme